MTTVELGLRRAFGNRMLGGKRGDGSMKSAGHYVLGTEGLALLRTWLDASDEQVQRRIDEVARIACASDEAPMSIRFDVPRFDVQSGYARWSAIYDAAPNPLIRIEEPVVRRMIDRSPLGVALDAACGTGRHTAYLRDRGHRVIGIDGSEAMLEKARARVPEADLKIGSLQALPLDASSVDLAVCALALTHSRDIAPAIAELGRVLRPGGRLVVSDLHPAMVLLGGTGFFVGADGLAGNVETFHHPHGRYIDAFRRAGLGIESCVEPVIEAQDLHALSGGLLSFAEEAFRSAWVGIPNALVWELVRAE
jgi:SAM-dependent methyltransferase